jgi:hypothetical protein
MMAPNFLPKRVDFDLLPSDELPSNFRFGS